MDHAPSGTQYELTRGEHRAMVVEVGGGLRAYRVGARELLDGYAATERATGARGQTLIPWPNRLEDGRYDWDGETHQLPLSEPAKHNAIHGLVRWANWTLAERTQDRVVLRHLLHPQPGYPFLLELTLEYALDGAGLTVRTTAKNLGERAAPYATGAHPYLTVGTPKIDVATLKLPAHRFLATNDRGLPTGTKSVAGSRYDFRNPRRIGETQLDVAFTDLDRDAQGRCWVELLAPDGKTATSLWLDASYPFVELFTGDALPSKQRQGLGVEPMTAPPNALHTGEAVQRIEPGQSFSSSWGVVPARASERP